MSKLQGFKLLCVCCLEASRHRVALKRRWQGFSRGIASMPPAQRRGLSPEAAQTGDLEGPCVPGPRPLLTTCHTRSPTVKAEGATHIPLSWETHDPKADAGASLRGGAGRRQGLEPCGNMRDACAVPSDPNVVPPCPWVWRQTAWL